MCLLIGFYEIIHRQNRTVLQKANYKHVKALKVLYMSTRGWRSDLQPVGTLLRAIAFVGRDAGLLPQLVLAMIKQLSRWTLTLLAGKYAVEIFAGEIK